MWQKKRKGNAIVYIHPHSTNAVVKNHWGVHWKGMKFLTVSAAQEFAEKHLTYDDNHVTDKV